MGTLSYSFNTRGGSGSIDISHSSLPTTGVTLESIDNLEIEFDLDEKEDESNSVFFSPAVFEFTIWDNLDDGSSFIKHLKSTTAPIIDVVFDFTTDDGHNFSNLYTFTNKDISYKREKRKVTIESKRVIDSDTTITQIFNAYSSFVATLNYGSSLTRDCMEAHSFIEKTMEDAVGANTYINQSGAYPSSIADGDQTWVVLENHDGSGEHAGFESTDDATTALYRLAVMDGSVIGSVFGYNFIANRVDTSDSIVLSENETEKFDTQLGLYNYKRAQIMSNCDLEDSLNPWVTWDHLIGTDDGLNDRGSTNLDVFMFMAELQPAIYTADGDYDDTSATGAIYDTIGAFADKDASSGTRSVSIDDGNGNPVSTGLSPGDLITFNDNPYTPHVVKRASSDQIFLETPLKVDVNEDDLVWQFINNDYPAVSQNALDGYTRAYGGAGAERIKLVIWDLDRFKPNQTIELGSDFPDGYAGNVYRPSRIKYLLEADKIELDLYQIS